MRPGQLSSALSSISKQKIIPAVVVDVLGNRCSVRVSSNGKKLTGLSYVGNIPSVGDSVLVDYRNTTTPVVITSTGSTRLEPSVTTAKVITGSSSRPPENPGDYVEWPDFDDKNYVARNAAWVEMPSSSMQWPASDSKYYVAKNAAWVEMPEVSVVFEDLTAQIDGSTTHYALSSPCITLEVFINGLRQDISYAVLDIDKQGFTIENVLIIGDHLTANKYGLPETPTIDDATQISDCILYLNEAGLSYSENDLVGSWTDNSALSNNAAQANISRKPIYKANVINGLPIVRFDSADDSLAIPITLSATPYTIAVVYAISGANTGEQRAVNGDSSNWLIGTYTDSVLYNGSFVRGSVPASNVFQLSVVKNHTLRINGIEIGTSSSGGTPGALFLGQNNSFWNTGACDIACVVVYNRSLSDIELESLEKFLSNKYNL